MKKIASFFKSTSGNVAITTALVAFPLMTGVAATVDYTNLVSMRAKVQNATDAAGLAAARQLETAQLSSEQELETYAKNFFAANVGSDISPDDYSLNLEVIPGDPDPSKEQPDRIQIAVNYQYDTIFGGVLEMETIEGSIASEITLANRTVEIALVLDNSGSMGGSRLSTLKREAKALVDIVHNSSALSTLEDPVKIAVVPFSGMVNIGTQNKNASWMDKKGWSDVHHENFDWDTYRGTNASQRARKRRFAGQNFGVTTNRNGRAQWLTRYDVFDMLGEEWAGCVEMRPWPHNVLDTSANSNRGYRRVKNSMDADGDGQRDGQNALFVPNFAPDEPDYRYASSNRWGRVYNRNDRWYFYNDYLYDFQDYNPSNGQAVQMYTDEGTSEANGVRGQDHQIERTNWMFKYQVNNRYRGNFHGFFGPNYGCTSRAITPLTTDRDVVKNELDQMIAYGSTNIQQGLTWGWRTLSERAPFTEGRSIQKDKNLKFLVALTDGNNFYQVDWSNSPNNTSYGAWGYARVEGADNLKNPLNGLHTSNRWGKGLTSSDLAGTIYSPGDVDTTPTTYSQFEGVMNAHTNQACTNIKNDGISIYAVAFSVPASGGVRELMEACAGSGIKPDGNPVIGTGNFYFDVDQGGLSQAFESIARQITNLRISG